MIVKQGNREFVTWITPTGQEIAYVYSVDGRPYSGKGYQYRRCKVCGKFICSMMGGATRHYKSHEKDKVIYE